MSLFRRARPLGRALFSYYAYKFFSELIPIYPVYMIMFVDRGFSYVEISVLLAIWSFPVVLLEVPSGVLADKWSRKGTIALGLLFKAACFAVWSFSNSFACAASGFVLWGVESAFCSGAAEAQLYDTLKREGAERRYESIAGRAYAFATVGTVVAMAAGGAIYALSPLLALALSSAACVAAGIIALGLDETSGTLGTGSADASYFGTLAEGVRECFGDGSVLILVIAGCLAGAAYGTIDEYDTLWAKDAVGVPLRFVGLWGAARLAVVALGGSLAGTIDSKAGLRRDARLAAFLVIAASAFALSAFFPVSAGLPAYFLFYFMLAAGTVMFERRLQDKVGKAGRATVLSIASLAMTLTAIAVSPLYGWLADRFGLKTAILLTAVLTASASLAFVLRKRRPRKSRRGAPPAKNGLTADGGIQFPDSN